SRPTPNTIQALSQIDGDLMILGVGGKMGPTLAKLAKRSSDAAGIKRRVIGVSRFSHPELREELENAGIETIPCDLLDEQALSALPQVPNVIYMVGMKFGSTGKEPLTWVMNSFLPGMIVKKFPQSRIVLFSSGNVYPFTPILYGGCTEETPPGPIGEYAQSVLGRERIFEHFARQFGTRGVIFRLNYAVEMRYGILLDVAEKVWKEEKIDLSMGHVNVIWQGDANAYALQALTVASNPPRVLNATGPELISIRWLAEQFAQRMGKTPFFVHQEEPDALLNNAQRIYKLFGYPQVPLGQIIDWVAQWVMDDKPTLSKPTKYQVRNGRF
ncbi:MAG: NAD(P)-dependent oxidoreductase, partial [Anaerolineae bacterium]|nr:NAD(P)-dependent oxidoreductase [Anaerolineae bacterium]